MGGPPAAARAPIHVPAGTATGAYHGELVVTGSAPRGTVTQTFPVELHVRSFTLPSTSTLRSNLRMSIDEICRAHGDVVGPWCPDQVAFRRWARLYGRYLLDHRVSSYLSDALSSLPDGSPDYATSLACTGTTGLSGSVLTVGAADIHKFRPTYSFCDPCQDKHCRGRMASVLKA